MADTLRVSSLFQTLALHLRRGADLLFPRGCLGCDDSGAGLWCARCAAQLPERTVGPLWLEGLPVYTAYPYAGPVAAAIRRLKYSGRVDLAEPLGRLVASALGADSLAELVVPVPLHARRLAERGFNQSALLGRTLARALGARLEPHALRRIRNTPQQAGQSRDLRLANLAGAFSLHRSARVGARRVLVVDDVVTTGTTLQGCIEALRQGGAQVVAAAAVCLAVGPDGRDSGRLDG